MQCLMRCTSVRAINYKRSPALFPTARQFGYQASSSRLALVVSLAGYITQVNEIHYMRFIYLYTYIP